MLFNSAALRRLAAVSASGLIAMMFSQSASAQSTASGVVISQFAVRGPQGGNDEFVEIYNAGNSTVAIGGWTLQGCANATPGGASLRATITAGTNLLPGRYFLFANNTATTGYSLGVAPDATFGTGFTDFSAGGFSGIRLVDSNSLTAPAIDAVGGGVSPCREGTGIATSTTTGAATAYLRTIVSGAVQDSNNNANDFPAAGAAAVGPRNSATPASPNGGGTPTGTSFAINDVTMAEGNSGFTNFVFTVTKTGTAAGSVNYATADGTATQPGDYSSTSGTLSFAAGDTAMTIVVPVVGDTAVEANETFTVGLSNASVGTTISDNSGLGTISNDDVAAGAACGDPATLISTVQGSGASTPLSGQSVQIEGIVIGDFQGSTGLKGFFVQEEDAQADNDPLTSEGIFVFEDAATPANVSINDRVRVMGMATESFGQTILSGPTTTVCANNQTPPAATPVSLPFSSATFAERYEGMRVTLPQKLFVTDNFGLGRFGEITLSSGGRLVSPTQTNLPGAAAQAALAANNLNQILIDDGNSQQNRDPIVYPGTGLTAFNTLRGGNTVTGVTGVMAYDFGAYLVQPTVAPVFVQDNPRTTTPDVPGASGSFRVASFNVLNFMNGNGTNQAGSAGGFPTSRGANTLAEFNRQRAKIIAAITAIKADVIGVIEMENDDFSATSALADLTNGLNASAASGTTYAFVTPAAADLNGTKIGGDEIKVSFIYRTQTAALVGAAKVLDNRFNSNYIDTCNRPALAQTFRQISNGEKLTVVVNHFKSKGSACAALNDADTGDGQGNAYKARNQAAQVLRDWLLTDPTASGDPDFLIIGDLNSYAREDSIRTLEAANYVNLVKRDNAAGDPGLNYTFDGVWGTIDFGLASPSLASQVTKATEWAINGAEPISLDYNVEFKSAGQQSLLYNADQYRASDHDPVVMEMALATAVCNAGVLGFSGAPYTVNEGAGTLIVTVQRTGGSCGTVGVTYATGSATGALAATAGTDYTSASGTLSFGEGETSKSFSVAISNDVLDEVDEVFGLGLSNATGGATFANGSTESTTATITDNDPLPTVRFALASSSFAESAGPVTVTLTLDAASGRDVTVPFTLGGTATPGAGGDYAQNTSSPVTFAAGETSKNLLFTINDDAADEPAETLVLTIDTGVANAQTGSPDSHTLTIEASDTAPTQDVTPDPFSFVEQTNTTTSVVVTSEPVTVSGITGAVAISVSSGAEYSLDGGRYSGAAGTITNGQVLRVRHTTPATESQSKTTTVTVGTYSTDFKTTNGVADRTPDAFVFTTQSGVEPNVLVMSNIILPAGFNTAIVIAPGAGQAYRIGNDVAGVNAATWSTARGTLAPGQVIQVRHTSSGNSLEYVQTTLKLGTTSGTFLTRTKKLP